MAAGSRSIGTSSPAPFASRCASAPVAEDRFELIINGIVRQLEASGENDIPSKQVGEMVMETLKEVDAVAYVRFASVYRNFREAKDFRGLPGLAGRTHIGVMLDVTHMRAALVLARRGLGTTWPNPSVGCVIVRDGRVVGRGRTAAGGRPHAETEALAMAGDAARGATAYVTLEPCNHTGQTPPCTEALIAAGVARVVIAGTDPDPRVDGAGIARLRAAGIEVVTGMLTAEADDLQAGFLHRVRHGRPLVTLKLATTLDGADRDPQRREPMDHRPGGARGGARAAWAARCGGGRSRHRRRR